MAEINTSMSISSYASTQSLGNAGLSTGRPNEPGGQPERPAATQDGTDRATISEEAQNRLRTEQAAGNNEDAIDSTGASAEPAPDEAIS